MKLTLRNLIYILAVLPFFTFAQKNVRNFVWPNSHSAVSSYNKTSFKKESIVKYPKSIKLDTISSDEKAHFIFSCGLSYQKQIIGEAGLLYGYCTWTDGDVGLPLSFRGIKCATEFNFNSVDFFIAPKVGAEFSFALLGARLNIIDYSNFVYHDLKLTPEAGLSLFGLNLFYGYNFSLTESRIKGIGTHRLTLTFNFDMVLWKKINGKESM